MPEHATPGASETRGPCPVSLSSEGRRLLAVSGSSWGPGRASSQVLWIVGCRLPLQVAQSQSYSLAQKSEALPRYICGVRLLRPGVAGPPECHASAGIDGSTLLLDFTYDKLTDELVDELIDDLHSCIRSPVSLFGHPRIHSFIQVRVAETKT